jgi:hypothetical protein
MNIKIREWVKNNNEIINEIKRTQDIIEKNNCVRISNLSIIENRETIEEKIVTFFLHNDEEGFTK